MVWPSSAWPAMIEGWPAADGAAEQTELLAKLRLRAVHEAVAQRWVVKAAGDLVDGGLGDLPPGVGFGGAIHGGQDLCHSSPGLPDDGEHIQPARLDLGALELGNSLLPFATACVDVRRVQRDERIQVLHPAFLGVSPALLYELLRLIEPATA